MSHHITSTVPPEEVKSGSYEDDAVVTQATQMKISPVVAEQTENGEMRWGDHGEVPRLLR